MTSQLAESFYSLRPNVNYAKKIAEQYHKKAIRSIQHLVEAVFHATKNKNSTLTAMHASLNNSISCADIYAFNAFLIKYLLIEKNLKLTMDCINQLDNFLKNHKIMRALEIINIDKYDWTREFAKETIQDAHKINGKENAIILPLEAISFFYNQSCILTSLDIMRQSNVNEFYDELLEYVSHVVLFDSNGVTGGSSERTMGAIFIRQANGNKFVEQLHNNTSINQLTSNIYYLEQLIHETAHLHLDKLMSFDPLILNAKEDLFKSPIRTDLRPMRGVFHATFVLARLCLFFNRVNTLSEIDKACSYARLQTLKKFLKEGIATINQYARLTRMGEKIFESINDVFYEKYK